MKPICRVSKGQFVDDIEPGVALNLKRIEAANRCTSKLPNSVGRWIAPTRNVKPSFKSCEGCGRSRREGMPDCGRRLELNAFHNHRRSVHNDERREGMHAAMRGN